MRIFLCCLAVIVAVTFGVSVAQRIPADTVAMGVGVLLGVLATVPISLLLVNWTARRAVAPSPLASAQTGGYAPYQRPDGYVSYAAQAYARSQGYGSSFQFPPVVVINPNQSPAQTAGYGPAFSPPYPLVAGPRNFEIIGEEA